MIRQAWRTGEMHVGVELIEGALQIRVVADARPNLHQRTVGLLDEMTVSSDMRRVRISEGKLNTAEHHRNDGQDENDEQSNGSEHQQFLS